MALSLGSIGNFFSRALDPFTGPSHLNQPATQQDDTGHYDAANFSDEMMDGMQNPLVESIAQTVQQIQLAQSFGGDPSTSLQQLQQEVQDAQSQGVSLPPDLQQAVDEILAQAGLTPGMGQDGMTPGAGADGPMAAGGGQSNGAPSSEAPKGDSGPAASGDGQASGAVAAPSAGEPTTWPGAAAFDQAQASEPVDFRNPEAWSQGNAGNCSSVAVIKAVTAESGTALFENVQKTDQGYTITTQDGRTVKLTQAELVAAEKTADFEGPDSAAKSQAVVAAGVIAKNYAADHPGLSYQQALNATNGVKDPVSNPNGDGRFPEDVAKDLGIPFTKTNAQTALNDVRQGRGQEAVVLYNGNHAEAVTGNSQGATKADDYGRSTNTTGQISKNGQTSQATTGIELHPHKKPATKAA